MSISDHDIDQLTRLFNAVADPTRAKILLFVMDGKRRSSDIAAMLDMTTSATSHQLRWLRERRIVVSEKIGRETFYALSDDCIREIIEVALRHIHEEDAN